MNFTRAKREGVKLLIGMIGPSGGGKTMSAMRLATGLSGGKPFAVIDTESGRSKYYASRFTFDHCDLMPPFTPDRYLEAILAAQEAGYGVIVIDSFSHEHAGEGGLLDWQEAELQRMAGDDWKKRDACKMAAWIKPKQAHKAMIQRLLQLRSHLILCFRAEEKVRMEKNDQGKTVIVPIGFQPICEKNTPYELSASFLLTPDAPGVPKPLKLSEDHKPFFPLDKPLSEESGRLIAEWADGGETPKSSERPTANGADQSKLKRQLWKMTNPIHRGDVDKYKKWLLESGLISESEDATALPANRLAEIIAKAEGHADLF